jgi:flagellar protein FliO/FliZ
MNPIAAPGPWAWLTSLAAVVVVLALFAVVAWLLKRGRLALGRNKERISIETATSIGDRRSLVIVGVEGRRLLLGVTPGQVSLITELGAAPAFSDAMERAGVPPAGAAQ